MTERPLILISNDDGADAQGIRELTRMLLPLGDLVVVAPDGPRSGAACSMTVTSPVSLRLLEHTDGLTRYACTGTPADCVKLALEHVVDRKPALMVSGINHGDNASVNVHYSGTMGAAMEACMKGIPAIGYSLRTRDKQCDFSPYAQAIVHIARHVLEHGLPQDTCLNVNFPKGSEFRGIKVCRMTYGRWTNEVVDCLHPRGGKYYWMVGHFHNDEPEAVDTDQWALNHGYVAVTPSTIDVTDYELMRKLKF